jgi:hypothetical protein
VSTTRVSDNLIRITRWRLVNAFLVREEDGFALVDTTVDGGADEGKDLDSARKLRELDPAVLVVGHGGPVRGPGPAMDEAIANAG